MARLLDDRDTGKILALNRQEAVEVIAFLTAQLADRKVPNNHYGACPTLHVTNKEGNNHHALSLILDKD